jgi:hypothetical protein
MKIHAENKMTRTQTLMREVRRKTLGEASKTQSRAHLRSTTPFGLRYYSDSESSGSSDRDLSEGEVTVDKRTVRNERYSNLDSVPIIGKSNNMPAQSHNSIILAKLQDTRKYIDEVSFSFFHSSFLFFPRLTD